MSAAPLKGLRLTQEGRETVRKAFRGPLDEQNLRKRNADRGELALRLYETAYTPETRRALATLKKGGWIGATASCYVKSIERVDGTDNARRSDRLYFGEVTLAMAPAGETLVPESMFDEYNAIDRAFSERAKEIDSLVRELNSVLLVAKTRVELAVLWPGAEVLMGSDWINKKAEPNTLPTIQTTNLDAALQAIAA